MDTKKTVLFGLSLVIAVVLSGLMTASASAAVIVTPITSYNPNTYWDGGVTAGIDFNDGGPTQAGFVDIPASTKKAYNVTSNGITFDVVISNAISNENRDRGATGGDLVRDFEQWYNSTAGAIVEGTFTLTGLQANTDYDISFFMFNIGSGNTTQSFYEGTSSSDPLITTFTTSGNQNNYATWSPGVIFRINSGSNSTISVTAESSSGGRLTINGVAVNVVPEPATMGLLAIGGLALLRRRRRS